MIYTSNYRNCIGKDNVVSISADRGRSVNFNGLYYPSLAPKKEFWSAWHDNIHDFSKEDNDRFYVHNYIKNILLPLDAKQVYESLDNCILVCYEKNNEFCHRHIVAAWFLDELGIKIPEVVFADDKMLKVARPDYIQDMYETEKHMLKRR